MFSNCGIWDKKEAIFDRFVQADISDKRAFQGAGLGLSISKAYVEMLGGKKWVESEEAKGSRFYFTIPYNTEPKRVIIIVTKEFKPCRHYILKDIYLKFSLFHSIYKEFFKPIEQITYFCIMSTALDSDIKGYKKYGPFLRNKYNGQRVFKVIVDAGFTCPNRDGSKGYGGCTYCNVDSYTPQISRAASSVQAQLKDGMARAKNFYQADKFIVYFQPNTNTYAPIDYLKTMYDEALAVNPDETVGFSVGTRPDCIDAEKIALLESYCDRFDVDLEMGMESIYDETLEQINRGCSHAEFVAAVELLKDSKLDLCVHTIFGFPWETQEMMLDYIHEINRFPQIKFVKFHHLHIVEGSIMGVKFKKNPFKLFTLAEYTDLLCTLIPLLRPDIVIQRLFGISDWDLLIGPNWGLNKSNIQSYIDTEIESRGIVQGSLYMKLQQIK